MRSIDTGDQTKEFIQSLYLLRKHNLEDIFSDITGAEFFALYNLDLMMSDAGREPVRISELGKRIKLSPQAVSKTLRLLEQKGYTKRLTSLEDRRITLIKLTKKGSGVLQSAMDEIAAFSRAVSERMGKKDLAEFIRLSGKCTGIIDDVICEQVRAARR